ncbi:MAG TPA: serine protease [Longimicrobium sp.]|jgi:endonuclease G|nr:serine protease [Longimicrobium sp.]
MCSNCSKLPAEEDLRAALANLSRKHTQMADLLNQTLELAIDEDVPQRAQRARELADFLARIVGGRPVKPGDFPECCLIGQESSIGTMSWFCTGVLVHPRVVLTAGHCVRPPSLAPNVVALNATNFNDLDGAEIVRVRRTAVHPRYLQTRPLNDLTVLILRADARTAPVPMASSEELARARRTQLVGFGNDDIKSTRGFGTKREVTVEIARPLPDELDEREQNWRFESDLEFVAGGAGYDSCNGDSGGPAYIEVDGARKVAGLTSRAIHGAVNDCGEGGVYTRVDVHRDFIRQTMVDNGISGDL